MPHTVAIDAMGGDRAPAEIVAGAVRAAEDDPALSLVLVGIEERVRAELDRLDWSGTNIDVLHADAVISMEDSPVEALRSKRGSSIELGMKLVKSGDAAAFLSAGNTGVCVAAATLMLRKIDGVSRAGIAVAFPAAGGPTVLIDCGANVNAKPQHLIEYGIMASFYARAVLGVENPRVGLLNIGQEDQKGNSVTKDTYAQFGRTQLNFIGNVEGGDIFRGACDVIVCDGFVGNTVLKVSEGLAERMMNLFASTLGGAVSEIFESERLAPVLAALGGNSGGDGDLLATVKGLLTERVGSMEERFHYAEYGGAPLLGVDGVVTIAHGRSDARAISSAISVAKRTVEAGFNEHLAKAIGSHQLAE